MRPFFLILMTFISVQVSAYELLEKTIATDHVKEKVIDRTSLQLWGLGLASSLTVGPYDERIRENWYDHQQMSKSVSSLGDFLGTGIPGVLLVGSQYFFDSNELNWQSHARALFWQTAVVTTMKLTTARKRPGGSENRHSFPSGHTATAFATATSLTYAYGWKAAVVAYPLATLVGLSRLADDAHWGSDVVAGAFVGGILARASVLDSESQKKNETVLFVPNFSPNVASLTCIYSF